MFSENLRGNCRFFLARYKIYFFQPLVDHFICTMFVFVVSCVSPLINYRVIYSCIISQNLSQSKASGRRFTTSETETLPNLESWNMRRPSSSVAGGLPPLGRFISVFVVVIVGPMLPLSSRPPPPLFFLPSSCFSTFPRN